MNVNIAIYKSQKVGTIQMPIEWGMNKICNLCCRILFTCEKGRSTNTCYTINEPQKHDAT